MQPRPRSTGGRRVVGDPVPARVRSARLRREHARAEKLDSRTVRPRKDVLGGVEKQGVLKRLMQGAYSTPEPP